MRKPELAPWVPSEETRPCRACEGTGWALGTLYPRTKSCVDTECINGAGWVPINYLPPKGDTT